MMFGLTQSEIETIRQKLAEIDAIEKAIIFGSRAMGNYKRGSDIDMAIVGKNLNYGDILAAYDALSEETDLPYEFDLVDYNGISNAALKAHIDTEGTCFWQRTRHEK